MIFDFRINHRATQHTSTTPPPERQKMAVFIACSRNTPRTFGNTTTTLRGRRPGGYAYLQDGIAYPEDFAREAKAHGIDMP